MVIRMTPEERAAIARRIDVIGDLLRSESHSAAVLGTLSHEQIALRQILATSERNSKSLDDRGRRLAHLKEIRKTQETRASLSHFLRILERCESTHADSRVPQLSESDRIRIDRFLAEHGVESVGLTVEELYTILGKLAHIDSALDCLSLRENSTDEKVIAAVLIRGRTALRARLVADDCRLYPS